MQRVHTSPDRLMLAHLRNLLEAQGIRCELRREMLGVGMGDIPPIECWPELWVVDDDRADEARRAVATALASPPQPGPSWTCAGCGEAVDAPFTACWRCGRSRLTPVDG